MPSFLMCTICISRWSWRYTKEDRWYLGLPVETYPWCRIIFRELKESGTVVKLFYQVVSKTHGIIRHGDISCFCQAGEGMWDYPCYGLQEVTLETVEAVSLNDLDPAAPNQPEVIGSHHSQWCIVKCNEYPYPGIILVVQRTTSR